MLMSPSLGAITIPLSKKIKFEIRRFRIPIREKNANSDPEADKCWSGTLYNHVRVYKTVMTAAEYKNRISI